MTTPLFGTMTRANTAQNRALRTVAYRHSTPDLSAIRVVREIGARMCTARGRS